MQEHTLIANSGIQIITFPLRINTQEKFKMWYHEWYDTENGEWRLDPVYELRTDDECYYYNKQKLHKGGYLSDPTIEIDVNELKSDDILPLRIEDENCPGVRGDIFSLTFSDKDNKFSKFENAWLPVPYFFKRTLKRFKFGPLNWVRMKLIPTREEKGIKWYNVVLAFDTRARYESDEYEECPVFPDAFRSEMDFELCSNEFYLMDYCSPNNNWSYIDDYLLHLVHPNVQRVSQLRGANVRKMSYIASYIFLINYLAQKDLFPKVKLYKDTDVEIKDVDMVVDIGNSRTTALLIEDNTNFNQVRQLELIDYTNLVKEVNNSLVINKHNEPFDMRLAFRKVDFGSFGIKDSKQFVHPSLVRLGQEANTLIHLATNTADDMESLSTYSSPKRYLWDWRPNKEEWKFLVLKGEKDDHILNLRGITNQLKSDGSIDLSGESGSSYHYSRRSLMTFSFLEMLVQARIQINSEEYRSNRSGFGKPSIPRRIRRIIVTCPTAMSRVEREALVHCAKDAVILLENFDYNCPVENPHPGKLVDVVPAVRSMKDDDGLWYYDEATCSQLVYMYGEVGQKYKGWKGFSPEQIVGRSRLEGIAMVSHETIYRWIWEDKRRGGKLHKYLRRQGRRYAKRGSKNAGRGFIPGRVDIDERPEIVELKERFGDLEIDTIIGKNHKGAILTINDRATSRVWIRKLSGKEAIPVAKIAVWALRKVKNLIHTITADNGKEFAKHEEIAQKLEIKFYFCKPYHSWERGANENTNGLIRQYIPKGKDFSEVTNKQIKWIENKLNNRPRKRLGYLTPNEKFKQIINQNSVAFAS